MGRKKIVEVKQIKSVYMPKSVWDKAEILAKENGFKSTNEFIAKLINQYLSSDMLRKAGI